MKHLYYTLYFFCKSSKEKMNLSSTGNCRYMHLLPFHMHTHHFIHYSYTYGKTSLTWFWKKKKNTILRISRNNIYQMEKPRNHVIIVHFHVETDIHFITSYHRRFKNHSSLHTNAGSGEQISSHTSAKQTQVSVYLW